MRLASCAVSPAVADAPLITVQQQRGSSYGVPVEQQLARFGCGGSATTAATAAATAAKAAAGRGRGRGESADDRGGRGGKTGSINHLVAYTFFSAFVFVGCDERCLLLLPTFNST